MTARPSLGTATAANAMTPAELAAFLAEPQEARLATVRDDGDVHLTPVWYLAEPGPGGEGVARVLVCLERRRAHLANLRRRPRATLLVDRDERPRGGTAARAAQLRCAVTLVEDEAAVDAARLGLIRRYRGPDAPLPQTPGLSYVLCELVPERVVAWDMEKG